MSMPAQQRPPEPKPSRSPHSTLHQALIVLSLAPLLGVAMRACHQARPMHPGAGGQYMSRRLSGLGDIACLSAPLGGLLTAEARTAN